MDSLPVFPVDPVTDARLYVVDLLRRKIIDWSEYSEATNALDNLTDLINKQ
jgi:uncharacterized protein YjiS (DUF1127 family)